MFADKSTQEAQSPVYQTENKPRKQRPSLLSSTPTSPKMRELRERYKVTHPEQSEPAKDIE
jgi:hypothetical protein